MYDRGISLWIHKEPVNASIYRFKYHNQRFYAKIYADEIVKYHSIIKSADLVEFNPVLDKNHMTENLAKDILKKWIEEF